MNFTTRLQRKKRPIILFEVDVNYSVFDLMDRLFMEIYCLNHEEFIFMTKSLNEEETEYFFTNELKYFADKRAALILLHNHLSNMK